MKHIVIGALSFIISVVSSPLEAQDRWNLEVRGGAAFPTQKLGNTKLATGYGLEGILSYRFMPHLSAYAGWGWNQFPAQQSFAGTDVDIEETGYTFGVQFVHPLAMSRLHYVIRAGGIFNHIEVENSDGDSVADSGHGPGWQVGAGLEIPLGERWRLTPGLRYRSLSREMKIDDVETTVDLNYLAAEIGVIWSF